MDIIYKKTDVRYHQVHIYILLNKWAFLQRFQRNFVNTTSKTKEEEALKKGYKKYSQITEKFTIAVQDDLYLHQMMVYYNCKKIIQSKINKAYAWN
jgi:hypothetical protein